MAGDPHGLAVCVMCVCVCDVCVVCVIVCVMCVVCCVCVCVCVCDVCGVLCCVSVCDVCGVLCVRSPCGDRPLSGTVWGLLAVSAVTAALQGDSGSALGRCGVARFVQQLPTQRPPPTGSPAVTVALTGSLAVPGVLEAGRLVGTLERCHRAPVAPGLSGSRRPPAVLAGAWPRRGQAVPPADP
ncbi:hypothetical protein MJG53_015652 [Ovis ammon polii x Ovis aries]|uniref:Uncharacterized protein n=1 Tax=Ovis ammon polii x Ovis aries TaxID=2918886 RepID=A0ACB9UFE2_9CETA|nr:hypothetical protein MJG53_015652 [Ovis ammon polii x Ovis aries]